MKRKVLRTTVLFFACLLGVGGTVAIQPAQAVEWFLDGKLELSGTFRETIYVRSHIRKNDRKFHSSNMDYARSNYRFEALYHLIQEDDLTVNLFGGLQYWYEKAPAMDKRLKRAIPHRDYTEYIKPTDDDIVTEAYVDILRGPWQLRFGKQIVIWGETSTQQTADRVNPLDLRLGTPGVDEWEQIKLGIWMFRGFYQTKLENNLLIELIFVPGDYRQMRLPPMIEGGHFGPSPADTNGFTGESPGITHWLFEKQRRDAPSWSLTRNWELGVRLRGYNWDLDWTLMYYNSRMDSPVPIPDRINYFATQYVFAGLRAQATGEDLESLLPDYPDYKVWRTPRVQVVGGTIQTMIESLHQSIWRLEWVYEIGNYFYKEKLPERQEITDVVNRDTFAIAIEYSDVYTIPYFTHNWFEDSKVRFNATVFYDYIFNHDHELSASQTDSRNHRPGDPGAVTIACNIQQFFWNWKGMVIIVGNYNPRGKGFVAPTFAYMPGQHWRWEVGFPIYFKRGISGSSYKDGLLLRMRHEW